MKLGPSFLKPTHRYIIKKTLNRKIKKELIKGTLRWNDGCFDILRKNIRLALREQQSQRCIFCRRMIIVERRNALEDIEHFLDKSKIYYRKWIFSPVNLAIACRPCNFVKSTRDLGDASVQGSISYSSLGNYLWLHPYFDNYHENIEIKKGWIYQVKKTAPYPVRARNLILGLELFKVAEMHSYATKVHQKMHRLNHQAMRLIRLGLGVRAHQLLKESSQLMEDTWPDL